jgi:hypothetical protein
LSHRPQVCSADLPLGRVDLVFLVLLPELIDPSEGVISGKDLRGQSVEDLLKGVAALRSEA